MLPIDSQFPIELQFRLKMFHNELVIVNSQGIEFAYSKDILSKENKEISVYSNEKETTLLFKIIFIKYKGYIRRYDFIDSNGKFLGKITQKGKLAFSPYYDCFDEKDNLVSTIHQENASLLNFTLSIVSKKLSKPKFILKHLDGIEVSRLIKKSRSMYESKFTITKLVTLNTEEELRLLCNLIIVALVDSIYS